MPVRGIPIKSIARNGVGAYVLPCHKITLQYCNWGGSSTGLRELLKTGQLNEYASKKKGTVFEVVKKSGHPILTFHYTTDKTQEVEVKNLDTEKIINKLEEYYQRTGEKLFKFNHKVMSNNESVRGIWSPLHAPKEHRYKI